MGVWGQGLRVEGLGLRVWGFGGFRIQGLVGTPGFRVGFQYSGLGFGVKRVLGWRKRLLGWRTPRSSIKPTYWVCGAHPSTLERKKAEAHHFGENVQTEIELEVVYLEHVAGMLLANGRRCHLSHSGVRAWLCAPHCFRGAGRLV